MNVEQYEALRANRYRRCPRKLSELRRAGPRRVRPAGLTPLGHVVAGPRLLRAAGGHGGGLAAGGSCGVVAGDAGARLGGRQARYGDDRRQQLKPAL